MAPDKEEVLYKPSLGIFVAALYAMGITTIPWMLLYVEDITKTLHYSHLWIWIIGGINEVLIFILFMNACKIKSKT